MPTRSQKNFFDFIKKSIAPQRPRFEIVWEFTENNRREDISKQMISLGAKATVDHDLILKEIKESKKLEKQASEKTRGSKKRFQDLLVTKTLKVEDRRMEIEKVEYDRSEKRYMVFLQRPARPRTRAASEPADYVMTLAKVLAAMRRQGSLPDELESNLEYWTEIDKRL